MSDSIDLGLKVRNFTKQNDFAEYENVELLASDKVSVKAKATGELLAPLTSWVSVYGQNQNVVLSEKSIRLTSTTSTTYGVGAFSSPANVRYIDVVGRTLRITADIDINTPDQSNSDVVIGLYLRKNDTFVSGSDGLYFKTVGVYSDSTNHVDFSFVVGDNWFNSNYEDAFLAMRIVCRTSTSIDATVRNLRMSASYDTETTTLTASCPWATPTIARQVLAALKGFHYRPYEARGARLDPAAELGDNVVIDYTGYGLYSQTAQITSDFVSDLSAPYEQEIDHEYPYEPSTERRFRREIKTLKAELSIAADEIAAKVSSVEGSRASFGWTLQKDNFTVFASGREVLKITKDGASISGHVVATSGEIGGCKIVDGVLQVASANIGSINADRITAGTLSADRIRDLSITSAKLSDNAVTTSKINYGAVGGNAISSGAVSYQKTATGVQSMLNQTSVNASNIQSIRGRLSATWFECNGLSTRQIIITPNASQTYVLAMVDKKPSNAKYVVAVPYSYSPPRPW